MSNFHVSENIRVSRVNVVANYKADTKSTMTIAAAGQRLIDLTPARDGFTNALHFERSLFRHDEVMLISINPALSADERQCIARSLRPAIIALGGRKVAQRNNTWRVPAENYKEAIAASYCVTSKPNAI